MEEKQLHIALLPGPDDPELEDPKYQQELLDLKAHLLPYHPQVPVLLKWMEAVAAPPGDHSGDVVFLLGKFVLGLSTLPSVKVLANFLLDWKKANNGREVSLEIDGVKAKAQTVEQIEALLETTRQHTESHKRKGKGRKRAL